MSELEEVLSEFKSFLNHISCIKQLTKYKKMIEKNKELMDLIKQYHGNYNHQIKMEIYKYSEFIEYKKYENEVNLLIMEINKELKVILNTGE